MEVKNITECVSILFQIGYCYYCMTKMVVMIYNVMEYIASVLKCEPHMKEYKAIVQPVIQLYVFVEDTQQS